MTVSSVFVTATYNGSGNGSNWFISLSLEISSLFFTQYQETGASPIWISIKETPFVRGEEETCMTHFSSSEMEAALFVYLFLMEKENKKKAYSIQYSQA